MERYVVAAFLLATTAIVVLLTGRSPVNQTVVAHVPAGEQAGEMTAPEPCEFTPPGSKHRYQAECSTLTVPENWESPGSRLITLPVVRIPATGTEPVEPVFFLQGGPGSSNLSFAPENWLLEKHDVIMVGYRGVDGEVRLDCKEFSGLMKAYLGKAFFSDQARSEYIAATRRCAQNIQDQGVDLAGYTVTGVIKDMEAARKALGYSRINLYSNSYGTRLAQIYAYLYPQSLHRNVLIGVNTPGHFVYDPAVLDGLIGYVSDLCAQDAECSRRTENLAQTMHRINHDMPKRWLLFPIDSDSVRSGSHFMFFNNRNFAMVLDAYLAADQGDASGLAMLSMMTKFVFPADQMVFGDFFNKGGTADLEYYRGVESISLGNSIMGAPLAEMIWPVADEWPLTLIPEDLRSFQESDVEMLLVNGTIDFSTPPNALLEAQPYYHNAQQVLLPEFSHVSDIENLQPQAFERLITSYYETGHADASLFVYEPLAFNPKMSMGWMAKGVLAAIVVFPFLLAGIVALGVRRVSRRRTAGSVGRF